MFDTRFERITSRVGNLFFLAAIGFFITLILLTSGKVEAQEVQFTDSLEPDALDEDALDEDALGLEPVKLEDVALQLEVDEEALLAYCHCHRVWFDRWTGFCHICRYPHWPPRLPGGYGDVPHIIRLTPDDGITDEFGDVSIRPSEPDVMDVRVMKPGVGKTKRTTESKEE